MIQIVPAILDKTPEDFQKHVDQLKNSENFQEGWVHIDFADNTFVPNKTVGIEIIEEYPINLNKEAHLMVNNPSDWLDDLKRAGFKRVVFHYESNDDPEKVIKEAKKLGMEVGIAINPETSLEKLEKYKDQIDQILIMGIVPGFQGQPFIPETYKKIETLKSKGWPVTISTDGAVRDSNARELVGSGVDQLVSGSFLLNGDIDENLEKLWEAINK